MSLSALNHFTRTQKKVSFILQLITKQKKGMEFLQIPLLIEQHYSKLPQQGCVHFCSEEVNLNHHIPQYQTQVYPKEWTASF